MAINLPEQITRNQYVGNGVQDTFAYTFKIFAEGDIDVYVTLNGQNPNPSNDIKVLTTDYTLTGVGVTAGGNVVFQPGKIPANLSTVTLIRSVPASLTSEFSNPTTFNGANLDNSLEREVTLIQQNKTDLDFNSIKYAINAILPNNQQSIVPVLGDNQFWAKSGGSVVALDLTQAPVISTAISYKDGFNLSNNLSSPDDTIDISIGVSKKLFSNTVFERNSIFSKIIDQPWAEGSGFGGLGSGLSLTPNTWYHVFAIYKSISPASTDYGFDTSFTAENLLVSASNYVDFYRIGSVLTDATSDIIKFSQFKDKFLWDTQKFDLNSESPTSAVLSVPPDLSVLANLNISLSFSAGQEPCYNVRSSSTTSQTVGFDTNEVGNILSFDSGGIIASISSSEVNVKTNTSRTIQIDSVSTTPGTNLRINTKGWEDSFG
jgi:hypothetical protein